VKEGEKRGGGKKGGVYSTPLRQEKSKRKGREKGGCEPL